MNKESFSLLEAIYPSITAYMRRLVQSGIFHHAYLITGQVNGGQHRMAEYWAALLACEHQSACMECSQCQQALNADLFTLHPSTNGSISIDDARSLQRYLSAKPQEGNYRIAIIQDADAFTLSAANALLKRIEEPHPKSVILLTTSAPSRIPQTIRSRVHQLHIPRVLAAIVQQYSEDTTTHAWIDGRFERLEYVINSDEIVKEWYTEHEEWVQCYGATLGERDSFLQQWFKKRPGKSDVLNMVGHVEIMLRQDMHTVLAEQPQSSLLYTQYRKLQLLQTAKKMINQNVQSKLLADYLIEVL